MIGCLIHTVFSGVHNSVSWAENPSMISKVCTDPEKSWKFMEFKVHIFQACKVLDSEKVKSICIARYCEETLNCSDMAGVS